QAAALNRPHARFGIALFTLVAHTDRVWDQTSHACHRSESSVLSRRFRQLSLHCSERMDSSGQVLCLRIYHSLALSWQRLPFSAPPRASLCQLLLRRHPRLEYSTLSANVAPPDHRAHHCLLPRSASAHVRPFRHGREFFALRGNDLHLLIA